MNLTKLIKMLYYIFLKEIIVKYVCPTFIGDSHSSCKPCPTGTAGGAIRSPNFPDDYGVSTDVNSYSFKCLYKFTTSPGNKVKVTLSAGAVINFSDDHPSVEYLQVSYQN